MKCWEGLNKWFIDHIYDKSNAPVPSSIQSWYQTVVYRPNQNSQSNGLPLASYKFRDNKDIPEDKYLISFSKVQ